MLPRLTIVTGKGGVGKTTLALALSDHYQTFPRASERQVFYISIDQLPDINTIQKLGLKHIELELLSSAEIYMADKLKSKTIAGWIAGTRFFKALLDMLPSFGQMIILGHIIDTLLKNPSYNFVVDSPSSGHTMTMIESMSNFRTIFSQGMLIADIEKMENFLQDKTLTQIIISAIPSEMSIAESLELKNFFIQGKISNIQLYINESFEHFIKVITAKDEVLPPFLKNKIKLESKILSHFSATDRGTNFKTIPFITDTDSTNLIKTVQSYL